MVKTEERSVTSEQVIPWSRAVKPGLFGSDGRGRLQERCTDDVGRCKGGRKPKNKEGQMDDRTSRNVEAMTDNRGGMRTALNT